MPADPLIDLIRVHHPELADIRRDIHAHPEMGLEEVLVKRQGYGRAKLDLLRARMIRAA